MPAAPCRIGSTMHATVSFPYFLKPSLRVLEALHAARLSRLAIWTAVTVQPFEMNIIHQHRVEDLRIQIHRANQGAPIVSP